MMNLLAKAWNEGYEAGADDTGSCCGCSSSTPSEGQNPYEGKVNPADPWKGVGAEGDDDPWPGLFN